jgi:hypothetical protein
MDMVTRAVNYRISPRHANSPEWLVLGWKYSPKSFYTHICRVGERWLIEGDSLACSDKIVPKHKFLFKLSLVFCCGHHSVFVETLKNLRYCPDLGGYFLIVSD